MLMLAVKLCVSKYCWGILIFLNAGQSYQNQLVPFSKVFGNSEPSMFNILLSVFHVWFSFQY